MPKQEFVRTWCAIAYLFPGLHPDEYDDAEGSWPRSIKQFAAEAWRRAERGELTEEELYPSEAQWSGLYDRMLGRQPEEIQRRLELASEFGEPFTTVPHQ